MIPGLGGMGANPKQIEAMMRQMGINTTPVEAVKVIVEKADGSRIVVEDPQVTMIEARGQKSLQVAGDFSEEAAGEGSSNDKGTGREDDADMVAKQAGVTRAEAEAALKKADGDIAEAIMLLENGH